MNTSEYEYGLNLTLTLTYVNVKCSNKLQTINVSSVYSKCCIRCAKGGRGSGRPLLVAATPFFKS